MASKLVSYALYNPFSRRPTWGRGFTEIKNEFDNDEKMRKDLECVRSAWEGFGDDTVMMRIGKYRALVISYRSSTGKPTTDLAKSVHRLGHSFVLDACGIASCIHL